MLNSLLEVSICPHFITEAETLRAIFTYLM